MEDSTELLMLELCSMYASFTVLNGITFIQGLIFVFQANVFYYQ